MISSTLRPLRLFVDVGEVARPEEVFEPMHGLARSDFDAAQEVAFAQHADKCARLIDHRQSADMALNH